MRLIELLDVPSVARMAADPASFRRYWKPDGQPIRVRQLGGEGITIRPGTSDAKVLRTTFDGAAHMPEVDNPHVIWDLGSNIGTTLAHLASALPDATILGVELNPANHAIAVKNVSPWSDRVTILCGAAWTTDGEVAFEGSAGREAGFHVTAEGSGASAKAYSLNTLLEMTGPPDYVKMDVEGAERVLLRENTEWAARTRSIKVELHGNYTVPDCYRDLDTLGFSQMAVMPQPWWPRSRGRVTVQASRG